MHSDELNEQPPPAVGVEHADLVVERSHSPLKISREAQTDNTAQTLIMTQLKKRQLIGEFEMARLLLTCTCQGVIWMSRFKLKENQVTRNEKRQLLMRLP
jgi:hypothetical protein